MILTGLDRFIEEVDNYRNRRIALIVNQTSVTRDFQYSWNELRKRGAAIRRIFTPEHGLFATEQDQVAVKSQPDIDCDIISLYGESYDSLIPNQNLFQDIDLVIFDIQDVGARYYTYVNTMALVMKSIEKRDIEMLILDRPNPIGGNKVEGPLLNGDFSSFVGIIPVTVRHGMTPAELALYYRDAERIDINLSVVKMHGWRRGMLFSETGLPWIPPSPNMPTEDTAYIYPGLCLIEGLNISEGRGTAAPFKLIGASFIEPCEFAEYLNSLGIGGVYFRQVFFKPCFNKYADEEVGGVFIHITDVGRLKPFATGIAIVKSLHDLYKDRVVFLKDIYEFNSTHPAFDLLCGSSSIREMILNGSEMSEIIGSWRGDEDDFSAIKREYHLYEY